MSTTKLAVYDEARRMSRSSTRWITCSSFATRRSSIGGNTQPQLHSPSSRAYAAWEPQKVNLNPASLQ